MGWCRNDDGYLYMVGSLVDIAKQYKIPDLINSINTSYTLNKIVSETESQRLEWVLVELKQYTKDNDGQFTQDYEIGWHLKKTAWGKGYATEAAKAILNYGFNILKLREVYSIVNEHNTASIRVTQRLGMVPLGSTTKYYNMKLELFKLKAPAQ